MEQEYRDGRAEYILGMVFSYVVGAMIGLSIIIVFG